MKPSLISTDVLLGHMVNVWSDFQLVTFQCEVTVSAQQTEISLGQRFAGGLVRALMF